MPVALVSKGTLPEQQVVVADLASIAHIVEGLELPSPTLVIIGEVVTLRSQLNWFKDSTTNPPSFLNKDLP